MNYSIFVNNSRNFLKNYITDNKLQSVIIGVSGGIDSTVSCAIASPVCRELQIPLIGRSLPCASNHDIEIEVADLVGNAFCHNYEKQSIEADYIQLLGSLEREGEVSKIQKGNIKARLRMVYLRHLASKYKGIVLDNDNFSEWNLGFWTISGDSPMDLNLGLHYLWKTEVYELAEYLANKYAELENIDPNKYKALFESIKLIPTDGNGVSSSDCEQFGLDNYNQVDSILKTILNGQETVLDSYSKQEIDKLINLHRNTEFKRNPQPIIPPRKYLGL